MVKLPAVYIMASQKDGVLRTGVTTNLPGRVWQIKHRLGARLSKRYALDQLVYFETADTMFAARLRERQIRKVSRRGKIRLIENMNPDWLDLYPLVSE